MAKKPDLSLSRGKARTQLGPGVEVRLPVVAANQGDGDVSSNFNIGFYLSANRKITPVHDRKLGSVKLKHLEAGEDWLKVLRTTLPSNLEKGKYFIGAIVDPANKVKESDETNNTRILGSFKVAKNLADLKIPSLGFLSGTLHTGEKLDLSYKVTNAGVSPVNKRTFVRYVLSPNQDFSRGNVIVDSKSVKALAAGQSQKVKDRITVPGKRYDGKTYYLGLVADGGDRVKENNETNNATILGKFKLSAVQPDLKIGKAKARGTFKADGRIKISADLINLGEQLPDRLTRVGLYLSNDRKIDSTDQFIGSELVKIPRKGGSTSFVSKTILPGKLTAGKRYYVGLIADYKNNFPEPNENNNTKLVKSFVVNPGRDLIIQSGQVKGSMQAGEEVTIAVKVKNTGTGKIPKGTKVSYYLSEDSRITRKDTVLGTKTLAALGEGKTVNRKLSVTLPNNLKSNTRYSIGAIVDPQNKIKETNENNNTKVIDDFRTGGSSSGKPDLTINGSLSKDRSLTPGSLSSADLTVSLSGASHGRSFVSIYVTQDANLPIPDTYAEGLLLGGWSFSVYEPGDTDTDKVPFRVKSAAELGTTGTHYVFAAVDAKREVDESNESNNTLLLGSFEIPTPPPPAAALSTSTVRTGSTTFATIGSYLFYPPKPCAWTVQTEYGFSAHRTRFADSFAVGQPA